MCAHLALLAAAVFLPVILGPVIAIRLLLDAERRAVLRSVQALARARSAGWAMLAIHWRNRARSEADNCTTDNMATTSSNVRLRIVTPHELTRRCV